MPSSTATDFYIYVVRARRVTNRTAEGIPLLCREDEEQSHKATREVEGNNDEAHPERGEDISPALPSLP